MRRSDDIAYKTAVVGKYSELIAQAALLANGWTVHEAVTEEAYDILAKEPRTDRFAKIQVKTIRLREDRNGDMVVYARKGNGTTYDLAEADYIVGILAQDGDTPKAYLLENRMLTEYWFSESRDNGTWEHLPLNLDREAL